MTSYSKAAIIGNAHFKMHQYYEAAEVDAALAELRSVLLDLTQKVAQGYNFNADRDNITLRVGKALELTNTTT